MPLHTDTVVASKPIFFFTAHTLARDPKGLTVTESKNSELSELVLKILGLIASFCFLLRLLSLSFLFFIDNVFCMFCVRVFPRKQVSVVSRFYNSVEMEEFQVHKEAMMLMEKMN